MQDRRVELMLIFELITDYTQILHGTLQQQRLFYKSQGQNKIMLYKQMTTTKRKLPSAAVATELYVIVSAYQSTSARVTA